MKCSLLLLAVLAASAAAVPQPQYSRFVDYTDESGGVQRIDLEDDTETWDGEGENEYILFTAQNPDQGQDLVNGDVDSILNSNFNPEQQTVVLVHGWFANMDSDMNPVIRNAYFNNDIAANIIVLDWRYLARANYVTSSRGVGLVGRSLGQFLAFLVRSTGASLDNVHLVGFNLGAHVVGNAGRELDGKVARITALDPAGPLFNINSDRLSSDDAKYVEVIHTDTIGVGIDGVSAGLGIGLPIGDADFYPNGGSDQPGCLTNICSHNRAWRFFAATIGRDHLAASECDGFLQLTLNRCRGTTLNMGNSDIDKSGSGMFRVNTRRRYPF